MDKPFDMMWMDRGRDTSQMLNRTTSIKTWEEYVTDSLPAMLDYFACFFLFFFGHFLFFICLFVYFDVLKCATVWLIILVPPLPGKNPSPCPYAQRAPV